MVAAMNIHIQVIPHNEQTYDTVGDYFYLPNGDLIICVSEMGDWRKEILVAFHELAESALCKHRDIPEPVIRKFDEAFERKRRKGNTDEPGDDPGAPYRKEHFFATSVERLLAAELKVDWKEYEETVNNL